MRYSKDKKIDAVVRQLLRSGWRVKSSNRHVRLENEVTRDCITVPCSPSDRRSVQNWLHQLKNQHGVSIP